MHAAAHSRRRRCRPATILRWHRESRDHRPSSEGNWAQCIPRHRRLISPRATAMPSRLDTPVALASAFEEESLLQDEHTRAFVRHESLVLGRLRQARIRPVRQHRQCGVDRRRTGDVRRPSSIFKHVALHGRGNHVFGEGPRPLPPSRPQASPRRSQVFLCKYPRILESYFP